MCYNLGTGEAMTYPVYPNEGEHDADWCTECNRPDCVCNGPEMVCPLPEFYPHVMFSENLKADISLTMAAELCYLASKLDSEVRYDWRKLESKRPEFWQKDSDAYFCVEEDVYIGLTDFGEVHCVYESERHGR